MISMIRPKEQVMDRIVRHFSRQSTFSILSRAYFSIVIITIIDYTTGPFVSMLVFYLIPIIITSWFVGKRAGLLISVVSAIGCSVHDILFFPVSSSDIVMSWLVLLWNPLISFSVFLIVASTLSAMRRAEDEKLRFEFKVAAEVQSRLFPQSLPQMKTLSYTAFCQPTTIISGDYYDFLLLKPNQLGIAIGDIAGKGISAALLMANLQGLLRSFAPRHGDNVAELMSSINNSLYNCTDSSKFATLFYGLYDDNNRTLTYVNAGHNLPIIFKRKNGYHNHGSIPSSNSLMTDVDGSIGESHEVIRIETGGTVIGAFSNVIYKPQTLQLHSGDTLVFFTDGLSEARNFIHEQYGEERLTALVASNLHRSSQSLHDLILNDVSQFIGGGIQFDDITLIVAKVN
jgi:serine phosphatase RsbU (regulator of sigma subunit)